MTRELKLPLDGLLVLDLSRMLLNASTMTKCSSTSGMTMPRMYSRVEAFGLAPGGGSTRLPACIAAL